MIEIKCKGCGEWIPLSRLDVVEGGIVARRRKFICPICRTTLYEETPSFQDWFAEELTAHKDHVRFNNDPFSRFPRWGTAEIGLEDLESVEVVCRSCKTWIPYRQLRVSHEPSRHTGYIRTYHCPLCGAWVGSSHGPDPAYGIAAQDFPDLVVRAVREGQGWARLMASEARAER